MEGSLLLLATIWSKISAIEVAPHLVLHLNHILLGTAVGIGLSCASSILFWLGKFPALKWLGAMREMILNDLAPFFSTITLTDVMLLAAASGFCEEVLFRGVIQEQFGLMGASVLFGLVHTPSLRYPQYGIWAMTAGILLGWLYQYTNSLWTPIFAHIVNNILGLLILRWFGKRATQTQA
jgi:membrane protease YdiL (CAAX protease family)